MNHFSGLKNPKRPDFEALIDNVRRKGTPKRVHHIELAHDPEIRDAIANQFGLMTGVKPNDPDDYERKKLIAVNRFCGFDYVSVSLMNMEMPLKWLVAEDTAEIKHAVGRNYVEEHAGPITTWEDFEKYPWPDPNTDSATRELEWFEVNLPDDMCIISHTGHFCEYLSWLMGYETLCYALHDNRDLVTAIVHKITELHVAELKRLLEFDRVKIIWGSDDMGFKTGLMISPNDMRKFVLPGHKQLSEMAHAAGRLYLLHSCGKLADIIDDLIDKVKIDAKHSFEDTIEDVCNVKQIYGQRIALLGGIDVDFLCRNDTAAIRRRVQQTLDNCMPGGGYCLGTGNSVANYIPLDNYLAMIDEGMLYGA